MQTEPSASFPLVHLDLIRMKQVLTNLMSNAIKFTPSGGTVRIESRVTDDQVYISVVDTGVGISAADLPRLFREFERIEPAHGGRPEGSGLGLALSRRLAELHGGTISVESKPGRGSIFTLRLPLHEDKMAGELWSTTIAEDSHGDST